MSSCSGCSTPLDPWRWSHIVREERREPIFQWQGDLGKTFISNWTRYIQEGGLGVAFCIAGCDSDGFFSLWEHLREHVYLVWPRTVGDRLARLQADVTAVDDDVLVLRYLWKNCMHCISVCLEKDKRRFDHLLHTFFIWYLDDMLR